MSNSYQTMYVVRGARGEYSDHREWDVAAYSEKEHAEEHARRANKVTEEVISQYEQMTEEEQSSFLDRVSPDNPWNPWDADYSGHHTPSNVYSPVYEVVEVRLYPHLDAYIEEYCCDQALCDACEHDYEPDTC